MTLRRLLLLSLLASVLAPLTGITGAGAQRRVTPPPRWVADNTLWPLQYVPYVSTTSTASMVLECAPYPATSPSLLRCTTRTRSLSLESLIEPYAAMLASSQPGELERELEVRRRRECGPEARPYERPQPTWSLSRQRGLERYNDGLRRLRGALCRPCSGPSCRDMVESIVTDLNITTCEVRTADEVLDLTPTGAMRWGSETLDPSCGGRLVHTFHAEGRDWVYERTRQFDDENPLLRNAPARCDDDAVISMRTGLPLYADPTFCTVLVF